MLNEIFIRPKDTKLTKPRIQFVDLAKGFCILLVLIDHCGIQTGAWTNHLRMPLYFVLSGLFFKDYGSSLEFLRKKTNNILIPFIVFYGIGLLYAFTIDLICHNPLDVYRIGIPAFFYGGALNNYALWFLLALLWTNLLFLFISKISQKEGVRMIVVFTLACLSYWINIESELNYIYIGSALMSFPIFYFGYLLRKTSILYGEAQNHTGLIWGGIMLIITILIVYSLPLQPIKFANAIMVGPRIIQYTTCGLCVMGFLLVCKNITWLPVISYMGRYSIIILVTHPMVIGISEVAFRRILPHLPTLIKSYCMLLITIIVCCFLIPFLKHYFPKITAQKDFFTKQDQCR